MAARKFYLRQNYQAELSHTNLTYPLPNHMRALGAIAQQYRLGCSASVAPVLGMDSPLRETMDEEGLTMQSSDALSTASIALWQFSSRSLYGDHLQNLAPRGDVVLIDRDQREPHDIGKVVMHALQENSPFLARYDSAAGELFYLLDFITNRSHRLEV